MTFPELNWSRLDVWALVPCRGVVVVDSAQHEACRSWLKRNDYAVETLDFGGGLSQAVTAFGQMLRWEEEFGYVLQGNSRNLDALCDGFEFKTGEGAGTVLELLNADVAFTEDPQWLRGLLSIASDHSLEHLALGSRFFTILVLEPNSPLIGQSYDSSWIGSPFSGATPLNPFGEGA